MRLIAKHPLILADAKKHSVRYDADPNDNDGVAVTALYILKSAMPRPYPEVLILTIEDLED